MISDGNFFSKTAAAGEIVVKAAADIRQLENNVLPMRVYFPQELDALVVCAGFVIEEKYGDYTLSPFTSALQKQLIVARLA